MSDEQVESAIRTVSTVPGAAQHALIHSTPAYRSAFREWLSTGGHPLYTPEETDAVRASLSLTGANGGFTLPTLLDPTLIHTGTAYQPDPRHRARRRGHPERVARCQRRQRHDLLGR